MEQKQAYFQPPPIHTHPQSGPAVVNVSVAVGPTPIRCTCPSCGANIITKMNSDPTTKTHLIALLLCALCCWPCCVLPYFMDSCKNANHHCPNCEAFIGTYQN